MASRKPVYDPADEAANRRMSALIFSLPSAVAKGIDAHLFLGCGRSGEAQLGQALADFDALPAMPDALAVTLGVLPWVSLRDSLTGQKDVAS